MNETTKTLLIVTVLGLMDAIIPFFPVLALILIYVILEKPAWFLDRVRAVYGSS